MLPILQNPEVAARTSDATRRALDERAHPAPRTSRYLNEPEYTLLQQLVATILPQDTVGTAVDIADMIDRRLEKGTNAGWRYADLPPDGEAYRRGLGTLQRMLQYTPLKTFAAMPVPAREGYLRCIANGDVDAAAGFPLSRWLSVVKAEAVRVWISHPDGMRALGYFGFADGATGNEGWMAIGPDTALPFETAATAPAGGAR